MFNVCYIDFAGYGNLFVKISLFVCAGFFFLLVLSIILMIVFDSKHNAKIKNCSNSIRLFVIDVKNDNIRYFNGAKLERRKTSSITDFYNQFPANQRENVIEWIGQLVDKESNAPKTLEVDVLVNQNKANYLSLLQVEKIDYEKQLIYVESFLMKSIANNSDGRKIYAQFLNREMFETAISRYPGRGVTIAIYFFSKKQNHKIEPLTISQIKNSIFNLISSTRQMAQFSETSILVSDSKCNSNREIMNLISLLKNAINRYLLISADIDLVGYSFGVTENKYFISDFSSLIDTSISLAKLGVSNDEQIIYYEEGKKMTSDIEESQYFSEVERIIKDKKLLFSYQPIFNIEKAKVIGYMSIIKPDDQFFDNIDELRYYAERTEDDKELFATIAKNLIPTFIAQSNSEANTLFLPISYNELDYINRTLAHIESIKDIDIVLIIKEKQLSDLPNESFDSVLDSIRNIKTKGFTVAINLEEMEIKNPESLYDIVDYFIISTWNQIGNKTQASQLPIYEKLIESLLKFNKKLVATNIQTWDIIELVYKLGIDIVVSDVIALPDENVLPLTNKITNKLKSLS